MKEMKSYNTSNLLRLRKYGFAAMAFFMGAMPMVAQDEVEEPDEAAVILKAKLQAKKAQQAKKYPTSEVKGKVVDAATGEPLAGVHVKAYNNSTYTAMTDEDGNYTINVPDFVTALSLDLEGYNLVTTSINGRNANILTQLYSDSYVKNYNAKTTGSKSVTSEGFRTTPALSIDQEIQNRLGADVRSIQRSANPAQGAAMFINGLNSLNTNAMPLVILDGVVYDQMYDTKMIHTGYFNNLLQAINVDDIKSVEVLKNGTAIYGAKAANGVIIINTKRCTSMATRIDVNINGGYELTPKTMEMMDAESYRSVAAQLLGTTDTKLQDFKFLNTDPSYYYYNMYHNNTNWKNEAYREAWTQNYGISIMGGDDVAQYNLSVGYTDAKSTLKANDFNRFNIRFNTDISLNQWFSTTFDASYTNVTRNLRSNGLESDFNMNSCASTSFLGLAKAPFLSPYDFATDGKVTSYISDADTYLYEVLGNKGSMANPSAILKYGEAKNKNYADCTMINIAVTPKWQPSRNLYVQERFAYTMQSFDESYFTPIIGMPTYYLPGSQGQTENNKWSLYTKHNAVFSDTRADWTILPNGAHRLELFGGVRFMNDTFTSSYLIGDNTGNDKTPNNSTGQISKYRYGSDTSWRTLAYYANLDYNYQEKYYLTGQFSMETSSRFGNEVKSGLKLFGVAWGLFPSIQGSWVMTNEKWFRPNRGINMLKINAGFESVGNDAIDNSATLTYMKNSALLNDNITSIGLENIGNTSLRWETTNRFNAGIEGNFLNDRLNLKFNYYKSWTNNLVTLGTLAYVSGLRDYYTNDGALENEGFDAAFMAKLVNARNFKFELGASVGHYKNKLTKLPQNQKSFVTNMYGGTILSEIGRSAGTFYGFKTNGVYATTAEAQKDNLYIVDAAGNKNYFAAGDMRFVDTNNDGVISDADRQVIGDPNPDIFGNINLNFYIGKHWTVSAGFNYSLGNDVYNYERSLLENSGMFMNKTTALSRRWSAEGQITDIPAVCYKDPMGNSRFSDRWIEDGSYLKMKNITVSYNIPVQNQYIQGITVWGAANNLFTLTKYLGADPEVSCGNGVLMQGIDAGYLRSGRSFNLGVKINL